MKKLIDRWKAPTPKFWKKFRAACLWASATAISLNTTPDIYPDWLVAISPYFASFGLIGALVAQLQKQTNKEA